MSTDGNSGVDRAAVVVLRGCAGGAGARHQEGPASTAPAPWGQPGTTPAILCGVTRAAHALRLSAVAAASLLVSGCAVFSPIQTDQPYIPAEGVPLTIPGLSLRNLAIVTTPDGAKGIVIGQVVNETSAAVDVQFGIQGGSAASGSTAVPAYSGDTISDSTQQVEIPALAAKPGSVVDLTVTTREAGQNVVTVPVLLDNRFYSSLTGSGS